MTRINNNVTSLLSQRVLSQNNNSLTTSLERLSTGLAINRGRDNPAGLIASENLRSETAAISAAISNAERADQVMNIAEGGLQEINSLLVEVQGLVGQSANDAGLSQAEKEANQLQIDSIIQTIDRIASTTSFQGTKLLNGTFDYTVSGQSSSVLDFQINGVKLEHEGSREVQVAVTASAQRGTLFLSAGATSLDLTDADSRFTIELGGALGSREYSFASGTSVGDMATTINTFTDVTGVSAAASGNGLVLKSTGFGSKNFVSFDVIDDGGQAGNIALMSSTDADVVNAASATAFSAVTNAIRDEGQDIGAIINGVAATSDGRVARINTEFLDIQIELDTTASQTLATVDAMTITGGGAKFNLGPNVDITNQVSVGIANVSARHLGQTADSSGNYLHLDDLGAGRDANVVNGNLALAQQIVNDAITDVSSLRGRIGAFQKNTVGATINSLGVALENTTAAESAIRDTDFAAETASLTRSQILVNASTNILSIANSQPQNVLALLG